MKKTILQYCIQCRDNISGQVGDFVHNGNFAAISPVFGSLPQFYGWMDTNGFKRVPGGEMMVEAPAGIGGC